MTKFEVTDAMLDAAEQAYDTIAAIEHDAWCYTAPTRAAITAAIEASGLLELITIADAVCDYGDSHCRWFDISTAPKKDEPLILVRSEDGFVTIAWFEKEYDDFPTGADGRFVYATHWRPLSPPPTNPPLPAVFTELGAALEKLKEGR